MTIAEDDFLTYMGMRVTAPNFAPAWFYDEGAGIVVAAAAGLTQAGIQPQLTHYAFCTNGSGTAAASAFPRSASGREMRPSRTAQTSPSRSRSWPPPRAGMPRSLRR